MAHRAYRPGLPLSQYVEVMWWIANPGIPPSRQPVYPDGSMALAIHVKKPAMSFFVDGEMQTIRGPLLAGPYSRSFHIDPSQTTGVIGIAFRPGGARLFFPVSAHELHNRDVSLGELHPAEADRLLDEVCSAIDVDGKFRVLERYLTRKLAQAKPIHAAVRYAVDQLSGELGVHSVRKVLSDTGLSHTRFIQLFREHVGLTPKLFSRVRRFRAMLTRIEKGLPVNWAALAAECGYFDQAHLIRDFREFAGDTPGEYMRTRNESYRSSLAAASES